MTFRQFIIYNKSPLNPLSVNLNGNYAHAKMYRRKNREDIIRTKKNSLWGIIVAVKKYLKNVAVFRKVLQTESV